MKTIERPLTTYDYMMEGCAQSSPEFRLLVCGVIERRPKQDPLRTIHSNLL